MESKQRYTEADYQEMNELKQIVQDMFRIDIDTKSRIRDAVDARMVFSRILRERGHQWSTIGRYLSKDHSTIIHLFQQSTNILPLDQRLMGMYMKCKEKFMQNKEEDAVVNKDELDFMKNQINILISENQKLEKYAAKCRRLDSIINLINSRTEVGKEKEIEKRINEMFNGF